MMRSSLKSTLCIFLAVTLTTSLAAPTSTKAKGSVRASTASPKTTKRPPTADEVCADKVLEEPLKSVCAALAQQRREAEKVSELEKAEAACAQMIDDELRNICIQLELAKANRPPIGVATSPPPRTRVTTTEQPVTGVPPRGGSDLTTQAPQTGFGGILSSFLGGSGNEAASIGDIFGSLGTGDGLSGMGTIGDALAEVAGNAFSGDRLGETALGGRMRELMNNRELKAMFGRMIGSSVQDGSMSDSAVAGSLDGLDMDALTERFTGFLEERGFDTDKLSEQARELALAFAAMRSNNRMMSDSGAISSSLLDLLQNSEQGQVLTTWGQKLVEIWRANRAGLSDLPRPDLVALASQAQQSIINQMQNDEPSVAAKGATQSSDFANTTTAPILGDGLLLGAISNAKLDSMITSELKNQAMANIFQDLAANMMKRITNNRRS